MARQSAFRSIQLVPALLCLLFVFADPLLAQISGTGAISGSVHDSAGAVVPGAAVTATNLATGATRQATSSGQGDYAIQLLQPGRYQLEIRKEGFATSEFPNIVVNVTQITSVNASLTVGSTQQTVKVQATGQLLQTESSTLGSVVTGEMVRNLPLVTRNYTQIINLSPGVAADVTNAGELGRGGGGEGNNPTDNAVAAGTAYSENNFQMDGVEINDLQGSGSFSGGVAIPNPDTIAEFKVQTSQYDASFGRNAGANVNVVTKTGTNQFHGSIWEFFRNEALNANNYFLKQQGQARPILRQNQPGLAFGGPIKHDKVFFFVSYQSTRQLNGVDTACSAALNEPPLTNDRSAAALGALFAGQPTFSQELGIPGGPNVLPDGSNIAPQALALFNLKLPNGQYIIPTPQRIDPSLPFAAQGVSTISQACTFNEDQFMTNGDWDQSAATQWQVRFFFANSQQTVTLPVANLGGATAPGFPQDTPNHFRNLSVVNNHIFSPNLLNQAEFGFHRTWVDTAQQEAFKYSDIGAAVPSFDDNIPEINFLGGITLGGNGQDVIVGQDTWVYQDTVSWTRGNHAFRFGGGVTRVHNNLDSLRFLGGLIFGTYSDALLGQSAAQNGTPLSNMYASIDAPMDPQREWRTLDYHAYAQDDYKVTPRLTLNLGFRYERVGDISDALGRTSNFNIDNADPNPPAAGTLQGFVVGSNFPGTLPPGVTRSSSKLAIAGNGQNTLNPRVGFAWQLPGSDRMVLRGGYGIYHETATGQPNLQLLLNPPYGELRQIEGLSNGAANWAAPIAPFTGTFPFFTPYSPATSLGGFIYANGFRPAVIQHYSLNTQTELARNLVLEVGYLGTRGQHILITRQPNQALSASATAPIRGQTDNTVANIPLRVPAEGFSTNSLFQIESTGTSWYNALLANLTKRFENGSEVQIAYTWSRSLSDTVAASTGVNGGSRTGDQTDPRADYGPDNFNRADRLIANFVYQIPTHFRPTSLAGETLAGWAATGVITVQTGHNLYAINTNTFNAFGISGGDQDFAEVSPSCSASGVGTHGSVTSKLNHFINQSCFTNPYPVIGGEEPAGTCANPLPDGNCPAIATGFGNTKPGLLRGPAQNNVDFALSKTFPFSLRDKSGDVQFRTELFNAFNTPQFADPGLGVDSGTFGAITTIAVAPRIMQLALKLSF